MERLYLLVKACDTLVFDYELNDFCLDWYNLCIDNEGYWLLEIKADDLNYILDNLFGRPDRYLKEADSFNDEGLYKRAYNQVKEYALGLKKPEYNIISKAFAKALIFDCNR